MKEFKSIWTNIKNSEGTSRFGPGIIIIGIIGLIIAGSTLFITAYHDLLPGKLGNILRWYTKGAMATMVLFYSALFVHTIKWGADKAERARLLFMKIAGFITCIVLIPILIPLMLKKIIYRGISIDLTVYKISACIFSLVLALTAPSIVLPVLENLIQRYLTRTPNLSLYGFLLVWTVVFTFELILINYYRLFLILEDKVIKPCYREKRRKLYEYYQLHKEKQIFTSMGLLAVSAIIFFFIHDSTAESLLVPGITIALLIKTQREQIKENLLRKDLEYQYVDLIFRETQLISREIDGGEKSFTVTKDRLNPPLRKIPPSEKITNNKSFQEILTEYQQLINSEPNDFEKIDEGLYKLEEKLIKYKIRCE